MTRFNTKFIAKVVLREQHGKTRARMMECSYPQSKAERLLWQERGRLEGRLTGRER